MISKKALLKSKKLNILIKKEQKIQYKQYKEKDLESKFIERYNICPKCGNKIHIKVGFIDKIYLNSISRNLKVKCEKCGFKLKWVESFI